MKRAVQFLKNFSTKHGRYKIGQIVYADYEWLQEYRVIASGAAMYRPELDKDWSAEPDLLSLTETATLKSGIAKNVETAGVVTPAVIPVDPFPGVDSAATDDVCEDPKSEAFIRDDWLSARAAIGQLKWKDTTENRLKLKGFIHAKMIRSITLDGEKRPIQLIYKPSLIAFIDANWEKLYGARETITVKGKAKSRKR